MEPARSSAPGRSAAARPAPREAAAPGDDAEEDCHEASLTEEAFAAALRDVHAAPVPEFSPFPKAEGSPEKKERSPRSSIDSFPFDLDGLSPLGSWNGSLTPERHASLDDLSRHSSLDNLSIFPTAAV